MDLFHHRGPEQILKPITSTVSVGKNKPHIFHKILFFFFFYLHPMSFIAKMQFFEFTTSKLANETFSSSESL